MARNFEESFPQTKYEAAQMLDRAFLHLRNVDTMHAIEARIVLLDACRNIHGERAVAAWTTDGAA